MCDAVRDELKKLNYARYRFVVSGQTSDLGPLDEIIDLSKATYISGYIAEKDDQDVKIASRALIDETFDRSFTITCDTYNCVVICSGKMFGILFTLIKNR